MRAWRLFWKLLRNHEFPVFTEAQVNQARGEGYQIGLAQGELRGRSLLAQEIEQMFPPGHAIDAIDAANVKAKQVH